MTRYSRILAILSLVILVALALGCNSKTPTSDNTRSEGLVFFEDQVSDQAISPVKYSMFTTLALVDSFLIAPQVQSGKMPDDMHLRNAEGDPLVNIVSAQYVYENGWHIFTFEIEAVESDGSVTDSISISGTDSVRVFDGGDAVQQLSDYPDSLQARSHYQTNLADSDGQTASGRGHHALSIGGSIPESAIVEASAYDSLSVAFVPEDIDTTQFESFTCAMNVYTTTSIENLTADLGAVDSNNDFCPSSGEISSTMSLSLDCEGTGGDNWASSIDVDGSWTVSASYSGNLETMTISDGQNEWSMTGPCGEE